MKFKLDENLDERLADLLRQRAYDVETVRGQNLKGTADEIIYAICKAEGRVLVSWDMHYANVLRYPPIGTPGLVVLRGPDNLFMTMGVLVSALAKALEKDSASGRLWVVEPGRVRIHVNPPCE